MTLERKAILTKEAVSLAVMQFKNHLENALWTDMESESEVDESEEDEPDDTESGRI